MKKWLTQKITDSKLVGKMQEKVAEGSGWVSGKIENSEAIGAVNSKISDGKQWAAGKLDDSEIYNEMQAKLAASIDDAFGAIIASKLAQAKASPNAVLEARSVDAIINRCAATNAAISGGAGLVPGPWGMVAVVPEIASVVRNQISMVYDIGVANGKEAMITKELLAGIVLTAVGSGAAGLLVMHGSKILVKQTSLRVFQKIVSLLAGKITQQALKSAISKWLPIVGAAFMAWLSGHMTQKIGRTANEIFSKEIEFTDAEFVDAELAAEETSDTVAAAAPSENK